MKTAWKWEYQTYEEHRSGIPVIIAAAGSSQRMGFNKMLAPLCGIPVLARTMLAFERSACISDILVAARGEDIPAVQLLAEQYMISKLKDIVPGGASRAESIKRAVAMVDQDVPGILIHDGARPLVTDAVIERVAAGLLENAAVICAVPVNDTIKRVDENHFVNCTLDRESLVAVQTPQGVDLAAYRHILFSDSDLSGFTDDASVMESAGVPVAVVEGDVCNLKITRPSDLLIAAALLRGEMEG